MYVSRLHRLIMDQTVKGTHGPIKADDPTTHVASLANHVTADWWYRGHCSGWNSEDSNQGSTYSKHPINWVEVVFDKKLHYQNFRIWSLKRSCIPVEVAHNTKLITRLSFTWVEVTQEMGSCTLPLDSHLRRKSPDIKNQFLPPSQSIRLRIILIEQHKI